MSGGGTCSARHRVSGSGAGPVELLYVPAVCLSAARQFRLSLFSACSANTAPRPSAAHVAINNLPHPSTHPHPPHPSLDINSKARKSLINQGGIIEDCFSPGEMSTRGREEGWDAWQSWDARLYSSRPWGMLYSSAGHTKACVTVPQLLFSPMLPLNHPSRRPARHEPFGCGLRRSVALPLPGTA